MGNNQSVVVCIVGVIRLTAFEAFATRARNELHPPNPQPSHVIGLAQQSFQVLGSAGER